MGRMGLICRAQSRRPPNAKRRTPNAKADRSAQSRELAPTGPFGFWLEKILVGCCRYSFLSPVLDKLSIHTGLVISVFSWSQWVSGFVLFVTREPIKQPLCHAIFFARANPVFWLFLEEKFFVKTFWVAKKRLLSWRPFIPELGSNVAGIGMTRRYPSPRPEGSRILLFLLRTTYSARGVSRPNRAVSRGSLERVAAQSRATSYGMAWFSGRRGCL